MDFIEKILEIQNNELLIKMADDNFTNKIDKNKFIEKYNKKNFRKFKIVSYDIYNNYNKIIIKFK